MQPAAPPLQIPLGPLGHWAISSLPVFWTSRGVTLSGQVGPGELVPSAHSSWPRGTQSRAVVCALTGMGRGWGGWVAQDSTTDCKWGSGGWASGGSRGSPSSRHPWAKAGLQLFLGSSCFLRTGLASGWVEVPGKGSTLLLPTWLRAQEWCTPETHRTCSGLG